MDVIEKPESYFSNFAYKMYDAYEVSNYICIKYNIDIDLSDVCNILNDDFDYFGCFQHKNGNMTVLIEIYREAFMKGFYNKPNNEIFQKKKDEFNLFLKKSFEEFGQNLHLHLSLHNI